MNKGITLGILGVLLCAMALVFFFQTRQEEMPVVVDRRSQSSQSEQASSAGGHSPGLTLPSERDRLLGIDPPVGGTPAPVVVGSGGELPRIVPQPQPVPASAAAPQTDGDEPPAEVPRAGTSSLSSGASLTPIAASPKPASPAAVPPAPRPVERDTAVSKPPAKPATNETPAAKPQPDKPVAKPEPTDGKPVEKNTPSAAKPATTASDKRGIKSIALKFAGQQMLLRIEADAPLTCKAYSLTGPDRLVVDLPGAWQAIQAPEVPQNRIIKNARAGMQAAGPRLVLDLERPAKHTVLKQGGNTVEIQIQ